MLQQDLLMPMVVIGGQKATPLLENHITNGVTVNPQLFNPTLEWDTLTN